MRLAPLNRFKPSSKIFYWPFQGGSFMFLFCLVFVMFCARLFICASWSPAGKGLTSWLSFVVSSVSLSLSHWYPWSGVVLDCIDSWSLQPYLLSSNTCLDPLKNRSCEASIQCWAFIGMPAKRHLMAFRWRVDDGPLKVRLGSSNPSSTLKTNFVKVESPLTKLSGSAHELCPTTV